MRPKLEFLSPEETRTIHSAALSLLSEMGMKMPCAEAERILEDAGAHVSEDHVVRIPSDLVDHAIAAAPKREQVTLYGREPQYDIVFERDAPLLSSMTEATHIIDPYTRERRPATYEDLGSLHRFINHLDAVMVNSPPVTPQDVPGELSDWYTWAASLKNTAKHITGWSPGAEGVRDAIQMASAAAGGESEFRARPFISFWVLARAPMEIDPLSLEAFLEICRWNIPSMVSSGPILGMTGPVTIAGMTAMAHAEILALLTLSQLVKPGAPVIYTSFARSMDMRSGAVSMSSPEFAILKGTMGQMGRSLGLATRMPAMLRDAKMLDAQAGFETGLTGAVSALSSDIHDSMQFDMDIHVDYADMVFCNEAMGALRRVTEPVAVDHESLALDVIKEVGHGGTFLSNAHTFKNFRKVLWRPSLFERRMYPRWEGDGCRDISSVALDKAREILAMDPTQQVSTEAEAEIDGILKALVARRSAES